MRVTAGEEWLRRLLLGWNRAARGCAVAVGHLTLPPVIMWWCLCPGAAEVNAGYRERLSRLVSLNGERVRNIEHLQELLATAMQVIREATAPAHHRPRRGARLPVAWWHRPGLLPVLRRLGWPLCVCPLTHSVVTFTTTPCMQESVWLDFEMDDTEQRHIVLPSYQVRPAPDRQTDSQGLSQPQCV